MAKDTRYPNEHTPIRTGRYEMPLAQSANLKSLDDEIPLGYPLVLDDNPAYVYAYCTSASIMI